MSPRFKLWKAEYARSNTRSPDRIFRHVACLRPLQEATSESFQAFKDWTLQARAVLLVRCGAVANLNDADTALWTGFARSFRLEHSDIRMITLELEAENVQVFDKLVEVLPTLLCSLSFDLDRHGSEVESEFAERDGQLFVARVVHRPEMSNYIHRNRQQGEEKKIPFLDSSRMLTAELGVPGLLESFRWKDDMGAPLELGPDNLKLELRAASVNLKNNVGLFLKVGYASENPDVAATLRRQGLGAIGVSDLLALLNFVVVDPRAAGVVGCSVGMAPAGDELGLCDTVWMADRRFAHLVRLQAAGNKAGDASADVARLLADAASFDDAVNVMCAAILQQLGRLIATAPEALSEAQSLDSYGVDSLVVVELRNWIGAYLRANVQLMVLRGTGSVRELVRIVAKESRLVGFEVA